jgi:hypothetical protein
VRAIVWFLLCAASYAQQLDVSKLEVRNVAAETTVYKGSKAVKLTEKPGTQADSLAILKDVTFRDGSIELEMAGAPAKGANEGARGFIGIAFHIQPDASHYEAIYLRPTNGRAADQLRRNHSTQYISFPDWPWEKLQGDAGPL